MNKCNVKIYLLKTFFCFSSFSQCSPLYKGTWSFLQRVFMKEKVLFHNFLFISISGPLFLQFSSLVSFFLSKITRKNFLFKSSNDMHNIAFKSLIYEYIFFVGFWTRAWVGEDVFLFPFIFFPFQRKNWYAWLSSICVLVQLRFAFMPSLPLVMRTELICFLSQSNQLHTLLCCRKMVNAIEPLFSLVEEKLHSQKNNKNRKS